jgi:adenosine deaminase
MSFETYVSLMPKAELHVHLEGSIRPETLLTLARRNDVLLPADTLEGIRDWYRFRDFDHFIQIFRAVTLCIVTPDDIELIAREFFEAEALCGVRYCEVTSTWGRRRQLFGLSFADQLAALNRARAWALDEFGLQVGIIPDISRSNDEALALELTNFAVGAMGDGVVGLGLGGPEAESTPAKFAKAYARARDAGLPSVPHAGEALGPESIWKAINDAGAVRIAHGVRCLEDPELVDELRQRQITLDVALTSNVRLGVFPSLEDHPLPRLIEAGLSVTLNSDDPPMFNTELSNEYLTAARTFGWGVAELNGLSLAAVRASLLPEAQRTALTAQFEAEFARLRAVHLP